MREALLWFAIIPAVPLIFVSSSEGQWVRTSGPHGGDVSCIVISGKRILVGTWDGVFASTDSGASWLPIGLKNDWVSALAVQVDSKGDTDIIAGTFFGDASIFRSTDNGRSWTRSDSGIENIAINGLAAEDSIVLAGTYLWECYRSTDYGTIWNKNDSGISTNSVHTFLISGGIILAGMDGGVVVSSDNGESWNPPKSGMTNFVAYTLAISDAALLAGSDKGEVYLSSDMGTSWAEVNTGFTNYDINAMAVSGSCIFAGTAGGGVFLSLDSGLNWSAINEGLNDKNVLSLAVYDSILFVGTDLNVWKLSISEVPTGVEQNGSPLPTAFSLEQNYPNPFNPSTVIQFNVPPQRGPFGTSSPKGQAGFVSLKVYDVLGREVKTLVSKMEQPGSYEVRFDGSSLPSGVYFYQLSASGYVKTMKMTLLK